VDGVRPYLIAYAVTAFVFSLPLGLAAMAAVVLPLPLIWVAMYYMGATGIWCSVRATSSWRSLLATLASGYGFGFGYLCLFWFAFGFLSCFCMPFVGLMRANDVLGVLFMVAFWLLYAAGFLTALCWALWKSAQLKLQNAARWVSNHEREGRRKQPRKWIRH
jgi:hypothetical protein